jgi:hypothetical protein
VVGFPQKLDGRVDVVTEKIFEAALGISSPWFIAGMNFEPSRRKLNIRVDFEVGSRFAVPGQAGELLLARDDLDWGCPYCGTVGESGDNTVPALCE